MFCCAHAKQIVEYIEGSAWSSVPGFAVHTIVSTACISAGEALRTIDHRHVVGPGSVVGSELARCQSTQVTGVL